MFSINKKFFSGRGARLTFLVLFTLGMVLFAGQVRPASGTLIYFYNPDANLRDLARLKNQVQSYFQQVDPQTSLKAFVRLSDLLKEMKTHPPDFLVAASWVTKNYTSRYGLKPLLVGKVGENRSYKKVLISKKGLPQGGAPSLSMVGFGEQNIQTLLHLVPILKSFGNVNVVEVNKDIDAVLAVSFDQVDLALVRSQNIDAIRKVNQSAVANIKVLAHSAPIEYPIFSAFSKTGSSLVDKFVNGLKNSTGAKAAQALELMGFEGWEAK